MNNSYSVGTCLKNTDFVVSDHQQYRVLILDQESSNSQPSTVQYNIVLSGHATLDLRIILTESVDVSLQLNLDMQGVDSSANIVVVYGLAQCQTVKIVTKQTHFKAHTNSKISIRGIVKDRAHVSYQGLISLQPESSLAYASQEHTTIVMSQKARVVSVPSIEVLHHDVQCVHAAAIGQFQAEHMWYLQTRGLSQELAKKVLVYSFFEEYIDGYSGKKEILERLCQKII